MGHRFYDVDVEEVRIEKGCYSKALSALNKNDKGLRRKLFELKMRWRDHKILKHCQKTGLHPVKTPCGLVAMDDLGVAQLPKYGDKWAL